MEKCSNSKCTRGKPIGLDTLYTTEQVALWLECRAESVLNYRRRGLLKGTKAGGWQFLGKDVMKFLNKHGNAKSTRKLKDKVSL